MQSFPQPPSAKEEREYLKRCRAGDKDARNALIERNLRLVAYIAKKYASMDRDMEDLISIGTIGLIKAVDTFRSGTNWLPCIRQNYRQELHTVNLIESSKSLAEVAKSNKNSKISSRS